VTWPAEVRLVGDGLILREWTEDDIPAMPDLFDDADVARFTELASPFDEEAARKYYDQSVARRAEGEALQLAITTDGGAPLGEVLLFRRDPAGTGELGYAVGPAHRGRNLAARAVRLLTEYAVLGGFDPIRLRIEAANPGSEAVARKAGYVRTEASQQRELEKGVEITLQIWEYSGS
jgi:RimJ/RimL family protein N-acetyltransferase